ncbi:MAG: hypothetical protein GF347_03475 [Candidatus Moranbacteria bacterium]|nr:hypothetical protein [Candidatus Moranbacteria bacterium]
MSKYNQEQLLEYLYEEGILKEEDLKKPKNKKWLDFLISDRKIEEDKIRQAIADLNGLEYKSLKDSFVNNKNFYQIPYAVCKAKNIISFGFKNQNILLASLRPLNNQAIKKYLKSEHLKVINFITDQADLQKLMSQYWEHISKEYVERIKFLLNSILIKYQNDPEKTKNLKDDLYLKKAVELILELGKTQQASEIKINPLDDVINIQYRIGFKLYKYFSLSNKYLSILESGFRGLSNLRRNETFEIQEGRLKINSKDRLKITLIPKSNHVKIILKFLDEYTKGLNLEILGVREKDIDKIREGLSDLKGLILIIGPQNSGRTTTLYTLIDIINSSKNNIYTVEKQINKKLKGLNQVEILKNLNLNNSLKEIIKNDPDVVMIPGLADEKILNLILFASLQDTLFLTKHNALSIPRVFKKLFQYDIERALLISSIKMIINQRLIDKNCPYCLRQERISQTELKKLTSILDFRTVQEKIKNNKTHVHKYLKNIKKLDELVIKKPEGCKSCNFKKIMGRTGVFEVLPLNQKIRKNIINNSGQKDFESKLSLEIKPDLKEQCLVKYLNGVVPINELIKIYKNK